nr:MAG TPA: hypothetical protein [Caudoviricetes sp.]
MDTKELVSSLIKIHILVIIHYLELKLKVVLGHLVLIAEIFSI